MALNITAANFDEIIASGKPVVIDFWAEWCGPCRMVGPIIDELATDYEGKVVVGKCDIDEQSALATKYAVRNIPTILFIKNGEVIDKQVGAAPKAALNDKIAKLL